MDRYQHDHKTKAEFSSNTEVNGGNDYGILYSFCEVL